MDAMLDALASQLQAMDPAGFWITALVVAGAAIGITRHGLQAFWRLRLVVDTPTARLRSVPEGYVELRGRARPQRALVTTPLSGTQCVWYRYRVEERRQSGRNSSWVTVQRGDAGRPFLLDDGTGHCLVDPTGALVRCRDLQVWEERRVNPGLIGLLGAHKRYRHSEERIHDGESVYLLGRLETPRRGAQERRQLTRHLLAQWKRDPSRMQAFDRDGNGQIDLGEWDRARDKAEALAERAEARLAAEAPLATVGNTGDSRHPFVISTEDAKAMLQRLRLHAYGSAAAALGLGVGLGFALLHRLTG